MIFRLKSKPETVNGIFTAMLIHWTQFKKPYYFC